MVLHKNIGFRTKRSISLTLLAALILLSGFSPPASAGVLDAEDPNLPWHIKADEFIYDPTGEKYIAIGAVEVSKGQKRLRADRVVFDSVRMTVLAEGSAVLIAGGDVLAGSMMEMDLESEVGTVHEADLFFQENHFYIKGDRIFKTGKNKYSAEKVTVTTCDGEKPAWKITARKFDVTLEGYGIAKHATFHVKDVPILYSPYLIVPAKRKRQTGFLMPMFGFSDRKGGQYTQPFFWAIDKHSDATFFAHGMSKRGARLGVEYRFMLSEKDQGAVMGEYLNDDKIDDGTGDSSEKWGYENDNVFRTNTNRYWFRMKQDQELPKGFQAKLDLDIVSDQDYLREFKDNYAGFNDTNSQFIRTFGRGLDTYDDPVRLNRLNVSNQWQSFQFDSEVRWYDNIIARREGGENETLQRLPYIAFTALKQPMFDSDFFYEFGSNYNYFYRQDGTRGNRVDLHPRVSYLFGYKHYLTVEPSLGVRETLWYINEYAEDEDRGDKGFSRHLIDFELDTSTELSRTYAVNSKFTEKIRHAVRPRVVYQYVSPSDQEELPYFDPVDRIEDISLVTYSLTNTFSFKSNKVGENRQGPSSPATSAFRPFCRFLLEQSYLFNTETELVEKPFTPIYGELELTLGRWFSIDADARWSTENNHFVSRNIALRAVDSRGDRFFIEYGFGRNLNETLNGEVIIRLTDRLSAFVEMERNLREERFIERGIGFLYMSQCWSIDVGYKEEQDDKEFFFMINLYGLGDLGKAYAGRRINNPYDFK